MLTSSIESTDSLLLIENSLWTEKSSLGIWDMVTICYDLNFGLTHPSYVQEI